MFLLINNKYVSVFFEPEIKVGMIVGTLKEFLDVTRSNRSKYFCSFGGEHYKNVNAV